jgi:hypothetical protein
MQSGVISQKTELFMITVMSTINRIELDCILEEVKAKAIPVTSHGGPQGCETLRVPHYLDNRLTDGVKVVSLTRRPFYTPQEDS